MFEDTETKKAIDTRRFNMQEKKLQTKGCEPSSGYSDWGEFSKTKKG